MLATEEKRAEITENRLSTLKILVASKGIDENVLLSGDSNPTLQVDIDGAIQRMSEQFSLYRVDIIQAFADSEGKIVTIINYDEFMKQIYSVTDENISTTDLQVIDKAMPVFFNSLIFYWFRLSPFDLEMDMVRFLFQISWNISLLLLK